MLARAVPCVPIIIPIVIVACHLQQASRQARRQPGSLRAYVRDSILQRVQFRLVSSSSQCSLPRRPRLRNCIYCSSPCSVSSTKGRCASSRLLSPDLHLGGSQRVRVPEYAAAPHLSPLLPGVIVRDNRRTSQPSSTKTRHCTPHSPSHLTTPAWLAYHHRPPTNYCFLALHRIVLIQPRFCVLRPTSRNAEHPNTLQSASRQR